MPAAVEVSRSGAGAHVWTFFTEPVAAAQARALGAALLREAMALRGELGLESYDRLFPAQDFLPRKGFGNLIALPLQGQCRKHDRTTVFVDPQTWQPYDDQWVFLSSLRRLSNQEWLTRSRSCSLRRWGHPPGCSADHARANPLPRRWSRPSCRGCSRCGEPGCRRAWLPR
jgi:hypothetical protein